MQGKCWPIVSAREMGVADNNAKGNEIKRLLILHLSFLRVFCKLLAYTTGQLTQAYERLQFQPLSILVT